MNKTLASAFVAAAALAAAAASSCSSVDDLSVVPHFDRIRCDTSSPQRGDTITLTAHQSVPGRLINGTTYTWTFAYHVDRELSYGKDTTVVRTVETNYDGIDSGNPVMGFRIPADIVGNLGVRLRATYSLSGHAADGSIFGEASASTVVSIRP